MLLDCIFTQFAITRYSCGKHYTSDS